MIFSVIKNHFYGRYNGLDQTPGRRKASSGIGKTTEAGEFKNSVPKAHWSPEG